MDIQGLFATGAGRAPSAAGQPEQVLRKSLMGFKKLTTKLDGFSFQEEEESEEAEEVQVEDSEEGGVRI